MPRARFAPSALQGAAPGIAQLIASVAGGSRTQERAADEEMQRQSRIAQVMAQTRASESTADLNAAKADAQRFGLSLGQPQAVRERAMMASGVPLDAAPEVDSFLQQGRIDRFDPEAGPAMPAPSWASPANLGSLAQRIAASQAVLAGDSANQNDYFTGQGKQFQTDIARAVMSGAVTPQRAGGAMAAAEGKPLFQRDATGSVLDQYSGDLRTDNQLAGATIAQRTAQAEADRAQVPLRAAQARAADAMVPLRAAQGAAASAMVPLRQAQSAAAMSRAAGAGIGAGAVGSAGGGEVAADDASGGRRAAAFALGVPVADVDPYAMLSPRSADSARRSAAGTIDKQFAERATEVSSEMDLARDAARFKVLNERNSTGGVNALAGVGAVRSAFDAEFAEMRAISNRIVPKMREPGSGATSDFDARMFQSATIGPDKPAEANAAMADAMIARAQLVADKLEFDRAYADINGHLRGADRFWKQYVDANPIFDPEAQKQGRLALNARRVPYQEFFRASMGSAAPANPPRPAPAPAADRRVPPTEQRRRDADRVPILQNEWLNNPADRPAIERELQRLGASPPTDRRAPTAAAPSAAPPAGRTVVRTGTAPDGRRVVQYSDGTMSYAD